MCFSQIWQWTASRCRMVKLETPMSVMMPSWCHVQGRWTCFDPDCSPFLIPLCCPINIGPAVALEELSNSLLVMTDFLIEVHWYRGAPMPSYSPPQILPHQEPSKGLQFNCQEIVCWCPKLNPLKPKQSLMFYLANSLQKSSAGQPAASLDNHLPGQCNKTRSALRVPNLAEVTVPLACNKLGVQENESCSKERTLEVCGKRVDLQRKHQKIYWQLSQNRKDVHNLAYPMTGSQSALSLHIQALTTIPLWWPELAWREVAEMYAFVDGVILNTREIPQYQSENVDLVQQTH